MSVLRIPNGCGLSYFYHLSFMFDEFIELTDLVVLFVCLFVCLFVFLLIYWQPMFESIPYCDYWTYRLMTLSFEVDCNTCLTIIDNTSLREKP